MKNARVETEDMARGWPLGSAPLPALTHGQLEKPCAQGRCGWTARHQGRRPVSTGQLIRLPPQLETMPQAWGRFIHKITAAFSTGE